MAGAGDETPPPPPEATVEVTLRAVGPGRPTTLRLPPLISLGELRRRVADERRLPGDRLRLVLRGMALHGGAGAGAEEDDERVRLRDGDSLMVAVVPKPPAKHLREDDEEEEEEEELKFQIPQTTGCWKRRIFIFLRDRLRLPDILLMAMFSLSLKAWAIILVWLLLAPVAQKLDLGPLYILGTGFLIILLNLGRRQQGDASAYSIFNEDFRELPGTLNADRIDRDIRAALRPGQGTLALKKMRIPQATVPSDGNVWLPWKIRRRGVKTDRSEYPPVGIRMRGKSFMPVQDNKVHWSLFPSTLMLHVPPNCCGPDLMP